MTNEPSIRVLVADDHAVVRMGFRMLLGRQAVRRRFVVDAARSFVGGKQRKKRRIKKPKRKTS